VRLELTAGSDEEMMLTVALVIASLQGGSVRRRTLVTGVDPASLPRRETKRLVARVMGEACRDGLFVRTPLGWRLTPAGRLKEQEVLAERLADGAVPSADGGRA